MRHWLPAELCAAHNRKARQPLPAQKRGKQVRTPKESGTGASANTKNPASLEMAPDAARIQSGVRKDDKTTL
jgi:hypothetical protein